VERRAAAAQRSTNKSGAKYDVKGTCDGEYSDKTGYHAEMDVLDTILGLKMDVSDIMFITISSPPCNACETILNVLKLIYTVVVPQGKGNKHGHKSAFKVPDSVMKLVADRLSMTTEKVWEYLKNI
jgi:hypothetical protein